MPTNDELVEPQVDYGAKLGARDRVGLTALDLAMESQFTDVSNLIVHLMGKDKARKAAAEKGESVSGDGGGDGGTVASGATGTSAVTAAANHSVPQANAGQTPNNRGGSADNLTVDAATIDGVTVDADTVERSARSPASGSAPNSPARSGHSVALSTGGRGQVRIHHHHPPHHHHYRHQHYNHRHHAPPTDGSE